MNNFSLVEPCRLFLPSESCSCQNLEIGLLFYYNLNGKDDDFLEAHNFSREEIMTGIQDLADRYQLSGIAEAFRTEIL